MTETALYIDMTTFPDLNQLRYATDPGKVSEPSEGKKDTGYVAREKPPALPWNWNRLKSFERFKLLQGGESHKIIGDATEKSKFTADLLMSELLDAALEAGDRIIFKDGTHTMSAAKTLSLDGLELRCQSYSSEIDVNGYILTLSGNMLRGEINVVNAVAGSVVISGSDIEGLSVRIDDPLGVDFVGSGSIVINGKRIDKELVTLEIANQPDMVVMTDSELNLYSNDDRFVSYDQAARNFKRRDDTVVPLAAGHWIVIKSLEELTSNALLFASDRLKIECHNGFQLNLGNQGEAIPYPVIIRGNNCRADLFMTQSIRDLAAALGNDKDDPMTNGLTAMENRRVIKNQGENNRIHYNGEMVFRGGYPTAHLDFVLPNHPYVLEWDGFIYDGLSRVYTGYDNSDRCWFTDLYYWLDRRFNVEVPDPDLSLAYHTVTMPFRSDDFFRPINTNDPDRHEREDINNPSYIIPSGEYGQTGDKITLQNANQQANIKNVKSGQRIQATGLPDPLLNTTVVRPGSIVTTPGSESFLIMDVETGDPVTASASGNLTMDFSGMAAGSHQDDALQNLTGSFELRNMDLTGDPPIIILNEGLVSNIILLGGTAGVTQIRPSALSSQTDIVEFDASNSPGAKTTTDETRARNALIVPYYRL